MGLNECDSLAEGKKADLIMLDLKQPNMQPENNLVRNIVYSGSKQNVKLTMVNGQILYEDNTSATVSSGAFFSNCSHPPNVLTAVAAAKAAAAYFIIRFINLPHSISIFSINAPKCQVMKTAAKRHLL